MAEQLRLFMTPREIMSEYQPHEADRNEVVDEGRMETNDEVWSRKLDKAHNDGLVEDIYHHGVELPVSLDPVNRRVRGGHHRIAAANHLNPDQFIPVAYNSTPGEARTFETDIYAHPTNKGLRVRDVLRGY